MNALDLESHVLLGQQRNPHIDSSTGFPSFRQCLSMTRKSLFVYDHFISFISMAVHAIDMLHAIDMPAACQYMCMLLAKCCVCACLQNFNLLTDYWSSD